MTASDLLLGIDVGTYSTRPTPCMPTWWESG